MDSEKKYEEIPDHNPKYDKTTDELALANSKIGGDKVDIMPEEKKERKTIVKDGKKLYFRSKEDYENIWESFIINEAELFEEMMGYGIKEIKRIGVDKFIDAFDWPDPLYVNSYRVTDMFHIIKCIHCDNEFANMEQDFGLCPKCQELYDLSYLEQVIEAAMVEVIESYRKMGYGNPPNSKHAAILNFIADPDFRSRFLKTTLDERDEFRQKIKEVVRNID